MIIEFINAITNYAFLQNAILACLVASVSCGIVGSYVVVKRISFLTASIAHCVLGGMGIAYFYNASPMLGAMITAVLSSFLIAWASLNWKAHEDVLMAAIWSAGMAIGILFMSKTQTYNVDLMHYLFGNILLIKTTDLVWMLLFNVVLITTVIVFYRQFLVSVFDEEFARLLGINTKFFYILLLSIISVTVVTLIQLVGLILVIALLSLPAAIGNQYVNSLYKMFLLAILICAAVSISGVVISFSVDLPSGSVIILLTCCCYFVSFVIKRLLDKRILN